MRRAHEISWILFALLAVGTVLVSFHSVWSAHLAPDTDLIAGRFTPAEVANGDEDLAAALSARRGTAAAYGLGYGLLLLGGTLAYRRERRFFGWLVAAGLLPAAVVLLRVPTLGVSHGLIAATGPLALVGIAVVFGILDRRARPD